MINLYESLNYGRTVFTYKDMHEYLILHRNTDSNNTFGLCLQSSGHRKANDSEYKFDKKRYLIFYGGSWFQLIYSGGEKQAMKQAYQQINQNTLFLRIILVTRMLSSLYK